MTTLISHAIPTVGEAQRLPGEILWQDRSSMEKIFCVIKKPFELVFSLYSYARYAFSSFSIFCTSYKRKQIEGEDNSSLDASDNYSLDASYNDVKNMNSMVTISGSTGKLHRTMEKIFKNKLEIKQKFITPQLCIDENFSEWMPRNANGKPLVIFLKLYDGIVKNNSNYKAYHMAAFLFNFEKREVYFLDPKGKGLKEYSFIFKQTLFPPVNSLLKKDFEPFIDVRDFWKGLVGNLQKCKTGGQEKAWDYSEINHDKVFSHLDNEIYLYDYLSQYAQHGKIETHLDGLNDVIDKRKEILDKLKPTPPNASPDVSNIPLHERMCEYDQEID